MTEEASRKANDIARLFFDLLIHRNYPWSKGFFRFYEDESMLKSTGSYAQGDEVELLSPIDESDFFDAMNALFSEFRELISNNDEQSFVALLVVDDNYNYNIHFDYDAPDKWEITKLDGATGIPKGYVD